MPKRPDRGHVGPPEWLHQHRQLALVAAGPVWNPAEVEHDPYGIRVAVIGGVHDRSVVGRGQPPEQAGIAAEPPLDPGSVAAHAGFEEPVELGAVVVGAVLGQQRGEVGPALPDRPPAWRVPVAARRVRIAPWVSGSSTSGDLENRLSRGYGARPSAQRRAQSEGAAPILAAAKSRLKWA